MRNNDYLDKYYHQERHWWLGDRSKKIVEFFEKYVDKDASILELGCSSGRNLKFLQEAGYKNVEGLEMSDDINPPEGVKIINGRWEDHKCKTYDVIFSASFLQEFDGFPQELFNKTLEKTKKYFMMFGDRLGNWKHPGFEIVEETKATVPFSQPIIICKKIKKENK